jgi:hypothetical protein
MRVAFVRGGNLAVRCVTRLRRSAAVPRTLFRRADRHARTRSHNGQCAVRFVTRLAEKPGVSEETIRQLGWHVSRRMLARYAHIRMQARRDTIASLERAADTEQNSASEGDGAKNCAQSPDLTGSPTN